MTRDSEKVREGKGERENFSKKKETGKERDLGGLTTFVGNGTTP